MEANPMNLSHTCLPIANLPGYAADIATGEIYNATTGRALRPYMRRSARRYYMHVQIRRKSYRVHRLVMRAALGRDLEPAEHVRHLHGNIACNDASSLAIGTAQDNSRDKLLHNTYGRTLRNADVREIRYLFRRLGAAVLATRYGVTPGHIRDVASGRSWAALPA